jgi:hypothetical protein
VLQPGDVVLYEYVDMREGCPVMYAAVFGTYDVVTSFSSPPIS